MKLEFCKIEQITDPRISIYAQRREAQLLHIHEPEPGIFIAESPKVIIRALGAGYEPLSLLLEEREEVNGETRELLRHLEWETGKKEGVLPVYLGKMEALAQITGFKLTRGALCAMRRKALPDIRDICRGCRRIAILENVVNPANVGAIFRSAAALHMDGVLLTPDCSDPLYRRAIRVGMGTVFQIPWTYIGSSDKSEELWPQKGMELLKEMGFRTVAMALEDRSVNITDPKLNSEEKLAIILGTEGEGMMEETIRACDYVVKIPMAHGVDSLNVAAASAIVFWQLGAGS